MLSPSDAQLLISVATLNINNPELGGYGSHYNFGILPPSSRPTAYDIGSRSITSGDESSPPQRRSPNVVIYRLVFYSALVASCLLFASLQVLAIITYYVLYTNSSYSREFA
eukprot:9470653-Pyramimonas_sp.AAC.1